MLGVMAMVAALAAQVGWGWGGLGVGTASAWSPSGLGWAVLGGITALSQP